MIHYRLHLCTNGGFEVEAFEHFTFGNGEPMRPHYVLRRKVCTIEEARWLLRVPLHEAQRSLVGVGPDA